MEQSAREQPSRDSTGPLPRTFQQRVSVVLCLFALFFADSLIRTPVPAVNEPHYLTKAKHFWNPDWLRGDLFLESSNPHYVFYSTVGYPTQWLSLAQTAWLARGVSLLLLAVGFESLLSVVLPKGRSILIATALYLGAIAVGNLAGEWMIGGVEGKVFAYGFAFWAAGLAVRGHLMRAGALLGLSVSFHPVVGIWCTLATVAGLAWEFRGSVKQGDWRKLAANIITAGAPFGICALPGLLPALDVIGGVPANIAAEADQVQVFRRLKHHLDPAVFSIRAYGCYTVMLCVFLSLYAFRKKSHGENFWFGYLVASLLMAVGGLFARFALESAALLKFYPFRLFDVFLPLATLVLAVKVWEEAWASRETSEKRRRLRLLIEAVVCGAALGYAFLVMPVDRRPTRMHPLVEQDWMECCRWVAEQTPTDARVLTPSYSWGFKWYGQRVEYVNYKDCPQDAKSLLEWQRRYDALWNWEASHKAGTISREIVNRFPDIDMVDFVISRTNDETDLPVGHQGRYFSVFDVRRER